MSAQGRRSNVEPESTATEFSRAGTGYVVAVVALGGAIIVTSCADLYSNGARPQWLILAALTLLSGSATVRLPSIPATISISETFVFTSVLLFGPAAGAVLVFLDGLIISLRLARRRREWFRVGFNMAAPAISIWFAAHVYFAFPAVTPLVDRPIAIEQLIVPLTALTISHFVFNTGLIALAVAFETRRRALDVWRRDLLWLSLNFFGGASLAALLVVYTRNIDLTYLGVIIPLLLVLYFTFKIPMARVEDANRHLSEVNKMYLSTIETLAMAVDAMDQVTHGHIRRVQTYAIGLAKSLNIQDPGLLKAIEAASLLHDMGKLAVPEHILNKPGKLTDAEFAKIKLHASIGADILSAIHFPYPVVPIVRHHHENWDGTGYPDCLTGAAIPIGARILAVVDCFDALTSDRPYRPRLPDNEAMAILRQRSGSMYDPLIVDKFIQIYDSIVTVDDSALAVNQQALVELARSIGDNRAADPVPATEWTPSEVLPQLMSISRASSLLAGSINVQSAMALLEPALHRILKFDLVTVLRYDAQNDRLELAYARGLGAESLSGWSIAVGEGLSGWVAATKQSATNSAAALDLAHIGDTALGSLHCALVVPILRDSRLAGVAGWYCAKSSSYNANDRTNAELIAAHLALFLTEGTSELGSSDWSRHAASDDFDWSKFRPRSNVHRQALLLVRTRPGCGSPTVLHALLRGLVGPTDVLFAVSETDTAILLNEPGRETAARIGARALYELSAISPFPPAPSCSEVSIPHDVVGVREAILLAQQKLDARQSAA